MTIFWLLLIVSCNRLLALYFDDSLKVASGWGAFSKPLFLRAYEILKLIEKGIVITGRVDGLYRFRTAGGFRSWGKWVWVLPHDIFISLAVEISGRLGLRLSLREIDFIGWLRWLSEVLDWMCGEQCSFRFHVLYCWMACGEDYLVDWWLLDLRFEVHGLPEGLEYRR